MNEAADIKRQEPAQIARAFLERLVGR
jgi:hypothetical protein